MKGNSIQGQILRVNLSEGRVWIERPPEDFFKQYFGGAIGAYYLLHETQPGVDPLDPGNIISFTPSFLSHLSIGAYNRVAITAKSPLTGAIIDSQAGGYWGPECKRAGFDSIVIQGKAPHPVYLMIKEGQAFIRDATEIWGLETGDAEDLIKASESEPRLRTCIIGPAGENLVRYANIANNLRHFAGRGGLGAVMGSKNLKAVAVRGSPAAAPQVLDRAKVTSNIKAINQSYSEDEFFELVLTPYGTPWGMWDNQVKGRLPTRNFQEGVFEGADNIDHKAMRDHPITQPSENCFACSVKCKRSVALDDGKQKIERRYGGAEYESLGNLGPLLGIDDLVALQKANELCSRYTIDTISAGATMAWAIDCFQRGIINTTDTEDLILDWGDTDLLHELIELIAHRRGFGKVLAEGSRRAASRFGPQAEALAVHNKGMEWPAVEPRVDFPQALAYAVSPIGADHMTTAGPDCGPGFEDTQSPPREEGLSDNLVSAYFRQRVGGSLIDGFGICRFLVGATGFQRTIELIEAATGWKTDLTELLLAGDRRTALFRAYNAREGFTIEDDSMPPRAFMPIQGGPEDGTKLDADAHRSAVERYYQVSGWDPVSGWPLKEKLEELDLLWLIETTIEPPFIPNSEIE
jgi:aldehyde:ferredoxin oxidoreductase